LIEAGQKRIGADQSRSIGRLLHQTSFDELPQLWNILKGDMSLVGPRSIIEKEIKKYAKYINDYYLVRPGLTGLWQVSGYFVDKSNNKASFKKDGAY